jgi:hypothetical protein
MDGLFFLMSVIGIALVMVWMARNDRVAPDKPTKGLFAMPSRTSATTKRSRNLLPHADAAPDTRRQPAPERPRP